MHRLILSLFSAYLLLLLLMGGTHPQEDKALRAATTLLHNTQAQG